MIRTTLTAVAFAAMTASAFADPMSSSPMTTTTPTDTSSMTCEQMMAQAKPGYDGMAMGEKKNMAMNDMNMAKKSMAMKNEDDCKMHMKKAMDDMK